MGKVLPSETLPSFPQLGLDLASRAEKTRTVRLAPQLAHWKDTSVLDTGTLALQLEGQGLSPSSIDQ